VVIDNGFGSDTNSGGSGGTGDEFTVTTLPIILDGSANDNDDTCSGDNIGQGAASAQQVVVGQLISFTACVPNPSFTGWGGSTGVNATWTSPSNLTTSSAVANYALSNPQTNTNTKLGNPQVFWNAAVINVTLSPNCTNSIAFCDFPPFYFVSPGTYDFAFSYQLGNGANATTPLTVEYIVSGPTSTGNAVVPVLTHNPTIQIFAPGQLDGNTVPILDSGNPHVAGGSALDVGAYATPPEGVPGVFQWVQKITSRTTTLLSSPTINCANCVIQDRLDNMYPYAITQGEPKEVVDNPSYNLSFPGTALAELNDNFRAQMYLMWDPSLNADGSQAPGCAASTVLNPDGVSVTSATSKCTGSIPVPLGSLTWGYCGTAINTLSDEPNTWILSCPANGAADVNQVYIPSSGTPSYPTWSVVYYNSN
jgi:hypothetical protein